MLREATSGADRATKAAAADAAEHRDDGDDSDGGGGDGTCVSGRTEAVKHRKNNRRWRSVSCPRQCMSIFDKSSHCIHWRTQTGEGIKGFNPLPTTSNFFLNCIYM